MRAVRGQVERIHRGQRWARIGEAQAASLTLDDDEPKAVRPGKRILSFNERQPIALPAERAIGLFPVDGWPRRCGRSCHIVRKKRHQNDFLFAPCRARPATITEQQKPVNRSQIAVI